jgi:Secretion system C-terminal sorting domain
MEYFFWGDYRDENNDVVADNTGDVYTCGGSQSPSYPGVIGAVIVEFVANPDAFVCKFNSICEAKWFTYYGGVSDDVAKGMTLDYDNPNAVEDYLTVVGYTYNIGLDFSSEGLNGGNYSTFGEGGVDGLYLRFDLEGILRCDAYIGGAGADVLYTVAAPPFLFGNDFLQPIIFIAGWSTSATNFPIQSLDGAYNQSTIAGGRDGFIFAYNASTNQRIWSTFYGGSGTDWINDISFKNNEPGDPNLMITGITKSSTYASANAGNPICGVPTNGGFPDCATTYYPSAFHQPSYISPSNAAGNHFVAEFDDADLKLVWGTYFGLSGGALGTVNNVRNNIDNNASGETFFTGCVGTENMDLFPYQASPNAGAYNKTYGTTNSEDAFLVKFGVDNSLDWCTFLGGDGVDEGYGISAQSGVVYVTGKTDNNAVQSSATYCEIPTNESFPICDNDGLNYIETSVPPANDRTFIMAFNSSDQLLWSTQYGNGRLNQGNALSNYTKLYLAGFSQQDYTLVEFDENSDLDYYQPFQGGFGDGTMARFDLLDGTVGINESSQNNKSVTFSIFPNPANNRIQVLSNTIFNKNDEIIIFNITGQIVLKTVLSENTSNISLDISKLASGVFTVQVVSSNTSNALKFIKQ